MVVRADRRLALLAVAKFAGLGALIGIIVGVGASLDGESAWVLLEAPAALSFLGALSLGLVFALSWWFLAGHVTYSVEDGHLTARRGDLVRQHIPVERIADVQFDQLISWSDLVFSGWFGFGSPIPALSVRMTPTDDRWDPSNSATVDFPGILLAGARQQQALTHLRLAIGLPGTKSVP